MLSSSFHKEQFLDMFFLNYLDADIQDFVQLGAGFSFLRRGEAEIDFTYYLPLESSAMVRPSPEGSMEGYAVVAASFFPSEWYMLLTTMPAVCFEVHVIFLPQTVQTQAGVRVIPTSQGFREAVVILKRHLRSVSIAF